MSSQPNACQWRFCTQVFSDPSDLQQHVAGHVAEAAPHPKQERDHEQEFKRQHGSPLEGATAGGERPHPHAELSMPELNRKTGEAEPAAAHPDQPR